MNSQAESVDAYLAELAPDRRECLSRVRECILKNLDSDYEEGMAYGMISYHVPHSVFPDGYHCNPEMPLPFISLGAAKNHFSLSIMGVYASEDIREKFVAEWIASGKKLDMGKACIRFKDLDGIPLDVVGNAIQNLPAQKWIALYQSVMQKPAKPAKRAKPSTRKKKTAATSARSGKKSSRSH